jgi:hypothetical protein
MATQREWSKAIVQILFVFPILLPILIARFLTDGKRASWKIWLIQILYSASLLFGFLDWLNGWTPDPVSKPAIYGEPSELNCDPRFYSTANGC